MPSLAGNSLVLAPHILSLVLTVLIVLPWLQVCCMSAEMKLSRLLPGLDTGVSRTVEPHPNNGLATVRPSMSGGGLVKGQPGAGSWFMMTMKV